MNKADPKTLGHQHESKIQKILNNNGTNMISKSANISYETYPNEQSTKLFRKMNETDPKILAHQN